MRQLSIAFKHWPPADQLMWASLVNAGGPLDDSGALSHLRQTSLNALREGYSKWLAFIRDHHPELISRAPAERVSAELLQEWIVMRSTLAAMSHSMVAAQVVRVLEAHTPGRNWAPEHALLRHLRRNAFRDFGKRKINRVISSRVLFERGLDHARSAHDSEATPLTKATHYRDGVMVAFLAMLPLRVRATIELEIGTSVIVQNNTIMIIVSEDMNKNGTVWQARVPSTLLPSLGHYIDEVRPFLLAQRDLRHSRLWVNDRGRPYSGSHFGNRIRAITRNLTGVSVSPQLFRDSAATTLARESPIDARLIRPILGHLSFDTAERHYIQAKAVEAGRDYAALLNTMKKGKS